MRIYNTATRRKEEFTPQNPSRVTMYCCGPTVYNLIHIGNARPMIVFDTVRILAICARIFLKICFPVRFVCTIRLPT